MVRSTVRLSLLVCFTLLAGVVCERGLVPFDRAFAQEPGAAERITKARELKSANQFKDAEKELKEAIKAEPSNSEAHYVLGWIYAEHGKRRQAVSEFQKSLEGTPPEDDAKEARDAIDRINKRGFGVKKRKVVRKHRPAATAKAKPAAAVAPQKAAPAKVRMAKAPGLPVAGPARMAARPGRELGIKPSGLPTEGPPRPGMPGGPAAKAGPPAGAGPEPMMGKPGLPPLPTGAPGKAAGGGPPAMLGEPGKAGPSGAGEAEKTSGRGGLPIPLIVGGVGVILVALGVWKKMQSGKG